MGLLCNRFSLELRFLQHLSFLTGWRQDLIMPGPWEDFLVQLQLGKGPWIPSMWALWGSSFGSQLLASRDTLVCSRTHPRLRHRALLLQVSSFPLYWHQGLVPWFLVFYHTLPQVPPPSPFILIVLSAEHPTSRRNLQCPDRQFLAFNLKWFFQSLTVDSCSYSKMIHGELPHYQIYNYGFCTCHTLVLCLKFEKWQ